MRADEAQEGVRFGDIVGGVEARRPLHGQAPQQRVGGDAAGREAAAAREVEAQALQGAQQRLVGDAQRRGFGGGLEVGRRLHGARLGVRRRGFGARETGERGHAQRESEQRGASRQREDAAAAIVASSAAAAVLAEGREQSARAAAGRQAEPRHRPAACRFVLGARWRGETPARGQFARIEQSERLGRQSVAAGAADLLIIAFDRAGQIGVEDEAHILLVDAHAEGDGRDHHHALALEEGVLIEAARAGVEPGVIGQSVEAGAPQPMRHRLGLAARGAIDDPALPRMPAQKAHDAPLRIVLPLEGETQIGPREGGDEDVRRAREEPRDDIGAGGRPRRRGDGEDGRRAEPLGEFAEPRIIGPELMAPMRDAMRLVDREQPHAGAAQQFDRRILGEPLRRDIDQRGATAGDGGDRRRLLRLALAGVQSDGGGGARHAAQLIAHQRDERRHDDDRRAAEDGRELIEQRFAGAGRHHRERVAAVEHGGEDALLPGTEIIMAEFVAQRVAGLVEARRRPAHSGAARWASSDMRTSSDRLAARILDIRCARCASTVRTLAPSSCAMILLDCPARMPESTSFSRPVSWAIRSRTAAVSRSRGVVAGFEAERIAHGVEQRVVAERLLQQIDGSRLHRADGERHIGMSGDHDDRKAETPLLHIGEQIEAARLRHAHIGDDAAALFRLDRSQKLSSRGVDAHVEALGLQQKPQGVANGGIVIDDMDDAGLDDAELAHVGGSVPGRRGTVPRAAARRPAASRARGESRRIARRCGSHLSALLPSNELRGPAGRMLKTRRRTAARIVKSGSPVGNRRWADWQGIE